MRCAHCGAALGRDAAWCGLCLEPVAGTTAPAAAVAPPAYADTAVASARAALSGASTTREWTPPPPDLVARVAADFPPPQPFVEVGPAVRVDRSASLTTVAAIAVGALAEGATWLLLRHRSIENEAAIRYAILSTLLVYGVVAYIVVRQLTKDRHPLRWRGKSGIVPSVAIGLLFGVGLASLLSMGATAAGHGGGDQRIALLVSEGDFAHIAAAVLIAVVAAPIVEELLFRGIFLASLMGHGKRAALWISAAAFSIWHLNPSALKYYTFAGLLLGSLYLKRGLSCSMAAHAGFNGTLTVLAITWALAPGPVATAQGLTVHAPHGWHLKDTGQYPGMVYLTGPSGGEVFAGRVANSSGLDVDAMAERIRAGELPDLGFRPRPETVHVVQLPAGDAVRVRVVADGRDGDLVMLTDGAHTYVFVLGSGGSPRVRADFDRMLETAEVR